MRNFVAGSLIAMGLLTSWASVKAQEKKWKQDTTQQIEPGRSNAAAQQQKPYVIMISADGFRYDYMDKYNAANLKRLSSGGVRAASMWPAFPSVTFPNHYTLATGLYPAHHGLVDNHFYDTTRQRRYSMSIIKEVTDSSWYGGEPLWVLAEKQQMLSASFYWVGSEAAVQGVRPTYWYHFGNDIAIPERIEAVKKWLMLPEEKRPHLITFYFPQVDHAGHEFGPDDPEVEKAVQLIDNAVGQLQSMLDSLKLPVNMVFVSDHGMAKADTTRMLKLPAIDTAQFMMLPTDMLVHIYAKDASKVPALYRQLKANADGYDVYLLHETPKRWNYSTADDRYHRLGDIVLVPQLPRVFKFRDKKENPGRHGFDPYRYKEMHATFLAWGPSIRSGKKISSFQNVHVYGLVAKLLGLKITEPTDSDYQLSKKVMRKKIGFDWNF